MHRILTLVARWAIGTVPTADVKYYQPGCEAINETSVCLAVAIIRDC